MQSGLCDGLGEPNSLLVSPERAHTTLTHSALIMKGFCSVFGTTMYGLYLLHKTCFRYQQKDTHEAKGTLWYTNASCFLTEQLLQGFFCAQQVIKTIFHIYFIIQRDYHVASKMVKKITIFLSKTAILCAGILMRNPTQLEAKKPHHSCSG